MAKSKVKKATKVVKKSVVKAPVKKVASKKSPAKKVAAKKVVVKKTPAKKVLVKEKSKKANANNWDSPKTEPLKNGGKKVSVKKAAMPPKATPTRKGQQKQVINKSLTGN